MGVRTDVRHYGWPVGGRPDARRYRGIDRDWVSPVSGEHASLAENRLAEIQRDRYGDAFDDFVFRGDGGVIAEEDDARDVLRWATMERPGEYELGWARVVASDAAVPDGLTRLGFEPSWFPSSDFSPLADCLLLPRWHGADAEGTEFVGEFESLTRDGLFATAAEVERFVERYLSFDWSEQGDYRVVEVFAPRT
jgi:hypothetical protein